MAGAALIALGACGSEADDAAPLDDEALGEVSEALSSPSISNAGFESDWTGWTRVSPTGLSTLAHSGSQSGKVSATSGQIKRTVSGLAPSTTYTLSAYVLGGAKIGARNFGGTSSSKTVSTSSWTKASVSFTTGSSNTSAEIYAAWTSGGDARVDDFAVTLVSSTTTSTTSCTYPSEILDLATWKLQLPIGDPTIEVKQPYLATYKNSPYFRVNSTCGGVRFRAPTDGTTTSGAEYPRTELREMTSDGSTTAKWSTTSGTHRLFIDAAVTALPKGQPEVTIGQIHDGTNDVITLRVEGSNLYVKPRGLSWKVLDSNYTLGKRFTVQFVVQSGYIKVYYNGSSTASLSYYKSCSSALFKSGAYTQSNCSTEAAAGYTCGSDDYGEVEIYDLWIQHS